MVFHSLAGLFFFQPDWKLIILHNMASLKLVHALALAAKACHLGNCWVQPVQALAMKKLMVQRLKALSSLPGACKA